jgi:hypothetical protein
VYFIVRTWFSVSSTEPSVYLRTSFPLPTTELSAKTLGWWPRSSGKI